MFDQASHYVCHKGFQNQVIPAQETKAKSFHSPGNLDENW
jgi:hypothetical protein